MSGDWQFFPTEINGKRAFVYYDRAYAKLAEQDTRPFSLKVRAEIRYPAIDLMPREEEHAALARLQARLVDSFAELDGIMVGRVTVDGQRVFLFYGAFPRDQVTQIIKAVQQETGYTLKFIHKLDREKRDYWTEAYPSIDDRQVMQDMEQLEVMAAYGDRPDITRGVNHRAHMPTLDRGRQFAEWIAANGYRVDRVEPLADGRTVVEFVHAGTMLLPDISRHSVAINRAARELQGSYDGWEARVHPAI